MTLDLKYYFSLLLARLHYVVLIFATVTAAAVTLAYKLPPVYETSATLLLEAPQIPDSLAASTVNTSPLEQLQVLQQRLMTRPNLLDIARKLKVFPGIDQMTPDDIVTAMQDATTIDITTPRTARTDQAMLMTITFDAGRAKTAADVVNEYVTRVLADNLAMRTSQAQDTLQFFRQEVDRLQGEMKAQSAKIVAFQNANTDALPGTLDTRLQQQASLEQRLIAIQHDISALQDQKQQLLALFRSTGQVAGTGALQSPQARMLDQARSDLASAQAIYAPNNPKLVMLQDRVNQLEAAVKAQGDAAAGASGGAAGAGGTDAQTAAAASPMLQAQLADIDARVGQLAGQQADVQKALAALKASIDRTPQVAVGLDALNRDYVNIQNQYTSASDRLAKATTGERIEAMSKGQRIAVLDAASVPDTPTKPNRVKIAALGTAAGLGLGLGFVLLLELLNTSIRRPIELARGLDITPIVAIPYQRSPDERLRKQLVVGGFLLIVVVGLPAALYAVDTYYLPLDIIIAKINTKLGL